jgi:hypothetical protein
VVAGPDQVLYARSTVKLMALCSADLKAGIEVAARGGRMKRKFELVAGLAITDHV